MGTSYLQSRACASPAPPGLLHLAVPLRPAPPHLSSIWLTPHRPGEDHAHLPTPRGIQYFWVSLSLEHSEAGLGRKGNASPVWNPESFPLCFPSSLSAPGLSVPLRAGPALGPRFPAPSMPLIITSLISEASPHHLAGTVLFEVTDEVVSSPSAPAPRSPWWPERVTARSWDRFERVRRLSRAAASGFPLVHLLPL